MLPLRQTERLTANCGSVTAGTASGATRCRLEFPLELQIPRHFPARRCWLKSAGTRTASSGACHLRMPPPYRIVRAGRSVSNTCLLLGLAKSGAPTHKCSRSSIREYCSQHATPGCRILPDSGRSGVQRQFEPLRWRERIDMMTDVVLVWKGTRSHETAFTRGTKRVVNLATTSCPGDPGAFTTPSVGTAIRPRHSPVPGSRPLPERRFPRASSEGNSAAHAQAVAIIWRKRRASACSLSQTCAGTTRLNTVL